MPDLTLPLDIQEARDLADLIDADRTDLSTIGTDEEYPEEAARMDGVLARLRARIAEFNNRPTGPVLQFPDHGAAYWVASDGKTLMFAPQRLSGTFDWDTGAEVEFMGPEHRAILCALVGLSDGGGNA